MSLIPLSREQLQAEGVDGSKRAQVKQYVERHYHSIIQAARQGQKEFFFRQPEKVGIQVRREIVGYTSTTEFIKHEDLIRELTELFPGVTITSIQQKGAAHAIYQQAGILLDWS